jgi:hypothetical protein
MKMFASIMCLIFLVAADAAMSNEYWPMARNSTYYYVDARGNEMTVYTNGGGQRITYQPEYYMQQMFDADDAGNVFISLWEGMITSPGYIHIPYTEYYSPPLQFLPAALEVGQTGIYSTAASDPYGDIPPVSISWEVTGREVVQVPAGTFDTIVLVVHPLSAGVMSGTYYLSSGVGPVIYPDGYRLVRVDGVVPASETSWGSLKALFR